MTNENQMDVFHYAFFNVIYCKQTFNFEELPQAHELLESRNSQGKIVIKIN